MNLYVGNLNFDITEDQIRELFEQVGEVAEVRLMIDRETGNSKGYGFVEMNDVEEYVIALKTLNGRTLGGRNIVVNAGSADSDGKKPAQSQNRNQQRPNNNYSQSNRGGYSQGGNSGYNNNRQQNGGYNRGGGGDYNRGGNYNSRPQRDSTDYGNRDNSSFNRDGNSYNRNNYEPNREGRNNYNRDNPSYNRDNSSYNRDTYRPSREGGHERPAYTNRDANAPKRYDNNRQGENPVPRENSNNAPTSNYRNSDQIQERYVSRPEDFNEVKPNQIENTPPPVVGEEGIKSSTISKRPRSRISAPEKVEKIERNYSKESKEESPE